MNTKNIKINHIVYRTHNLINQKEYTGKHSTNNLEDGYYGSGKLICKAVKKYGIENFAVEILSYHDTEIAARIAELEIVDEEYIWRDDTYNLALGGDVGWYGLVTVKDENGKVFQITKDDPRYLSGEFIHINKGKSVVEDKNGNIISTDNFNQSVHKGIQSKMVSVKDKSGNTMSVSVDDSRYLSGELSYILNGTISVYEKSGNIIRVTKDDPRYLSRDVTPVAKGKISVKDKDGNTFQVDTADHRYLSGELVGVSKGVPIKPSKIKICPYCNKEFKARGIKRHIDKCKNLTFFPFYHSHIQVTEFFFYNNLNQFDI